MSDWIAAHGGITGAVAASVVYILIVCSLISFIVMIERTLTLHAVRKQEDTDYNALRTALRARDMGAVRSRAAQSASPLAASLQAGLDAGDLGQEQMSDAIDQEVSMQSATLGRNLPVLATIASVAPYIGLFGTVLGILSAFKKIAETGQTGAKAVAGPISEALIATGWGLGVAIPAVIAYNYFSGRVNALSLHVENHSLELGPRLQASVAAESGTTPEIAASVSVPARTPAPATAGGAHAAR